MYVFSGSSCVLKWEDPHDSVVYCVDSDRKWMVISGTNRYGVVRYVITSLSRLLCTLMAKAVFYGPLKFDAGLILLPKGV